MAMKQKLWSEKQAFKDDLRPKYILSALVNNEVITSEDRERILEYTYPPEQVEKLVSILMDKSELQLNDFIKVLEEEDESGCRPYPWLAKKLKITKYLSDKVNKILIKGNVPFQINHLLPRNEKLEIIRDKLDKAADNNKRHWVVLHGPIGSGKSVLAAEAVRDTKLIEKCFSDGVYWLPIGNIKGDNAIKNKIKNLFELMELKTDFPTDASCSVLNAKLKKEVLGMGCILLILDDVFNTNIIEAFDIGCPILVTTKILNSVSRISDYTSLVPCGNDLKNDEILFILSRYVNCEKYQLPKVVDEISEKCIKSPLFTCLIGSYMADIGNNERKWGDLNKKLIDQGILKTVRKRNPSGDTGNEYECEDYAKVVNIFLEQIRDWKEYKEYYLDFLIFQRYINVTNKVLEILWDSEEIVENMMTPLSNGCLVDMEYKNEEKISCYFIHEIFLLALEKHIEHTDDIQKRHKKLVEKILKFCELPDGSYDWKKLPEHYIPFTFGYHLYEAGDRTLFEKFYLDLKLLEQLIHLNKNQVETVISNFFYYENDEAEMFKSFLKRNKIALMKGNDIIQLALFEPNDSIVYKKAKDYASTINNAKYFDWYNKEGNNPSLFSCRTVKDFVGIKHAVFNNDASLIAVVGKSFVTIQEKDSGEKLQLYMKNKESRPKINKEIGPKENEKVMPKKNKKIRPVIKYCSFNSKANFLVVACGSEVKIFKIGESLTSSGEFSKKRLSIPNIQKSNKPELLDIDKSIVSFNEHNSEVVCCSYSHDDLHIISSDSSEKTYVWEVCTEPKPYWLIKHSIQNPYSKKDLRFSCFSNNKKSFAAAFDDTIRLYDFKSGKLTDIIPLNNCIKTFVFSFDDSHIFSVYDSIISTWTEETKTVKFKDICPSKAFVICSCCASPDGKYIACGTSSGSIFIISVKFQFIVNRFDGHNDAFVTNVMFTRDSKSLFSVSSNQCIIHDVSFLKDEQYRNIEGNLSVQMRENGQEIVVVTSDFFNCIEVRKGLEGRLDVKSNPEEDNITSCSLSPDCSEVVYGMKSGFVKVFNIATQISLELSPNHSKQVTYILHSKYNSIFFTCSEDKTIKAWERGSNLFTLIGHRDAIVMCTEFKDSDGSPLLLSCSKDGTLRAWKISDSTLNERCLYTTEGHGNQVVTFCDVSPCENYIASSSVDGTVKVWRAENGQSVKSFPMEEENICVRCCKFLHSSEVLIAGLDNGKIVFCHFSGKQVLTKLENPHESIVHRIMTAPKNDSPNEPLFLSISNDIKLWCRRGQLLHTILLPSSSNVRPSIWASDNFNILIVIFNTNLYILKMIK